MRAFTIFLVSCASVFGGDGNIRIVTTVRTNVETASIYTKDFYTRDGQTNMVRHTKAKTGVIQIRIHRFYHAGSLVGDYVAMRDSTAFTTEASIPYSVSMEWDAFRNPKSVVISTKEGVILDAFSYTNRIFSPVENLILTNANSVGLEVRGAMDELRERSKNK